MQVVYSVCTSIKPKIKTISFQVIRARPLSPIWGFLTVLWLCRSHKDVRSPSRDMSVGQGTHCRDARPAELATRQSARQRPAEATVTGAPRVFGILECFHRALLQAIMLRYT